MTIFAVLLPNPQPDLANRIRAKFNGNSLQVTDTQILISTTGTAYDVSVEIGLIDPDNPNTPASGNAIVFATSGYFGRAPSNVWEWIKAKLETPAPPRSAASG